VDTPDLSAQRNRGLFVPNNARDRLGRCRFLLQTTTGREERNGRGTRPPEARLRAEGGFGWDPQATLSGAGWMRKSEILGEVARWALVSGALGCALYLLPTAAPSGSVRANTTVASRPAVKTMRPQHGADVHAAAAGPASEPSRQTLGARPLPTSGQAAEPPKLAALETPPKSGVDGQRSPESPKTTATVREPSHRLLRHGRARRTVLTRHRHRRHGHWSYRLTRR
jgi:hypothetical protein